MAQGGIPCLCCFATEPPQQANTKNKQNAVVYARFLDFQTFPNTFDLALGNACCKDPCCCCISGLCAPAGCTSCYFRNKALAETPDMDGRPPAGGWPYQCCQGYIPRICCCPNPFHECNNPICVYFEGFCCPIFSLSITRIFLMDKLQIRPDPGDYQIIQFSNCLQCLACICQVAAIFIAPLKDLADCVDCLADIVTLSVAGCMGAQINAELNVSSISFARESFFVPRSSSLTSPLLPSIAFNTSQNKMKYANGVANAGANLAYSPTNAVAVAEPTYPMPVQAQPVMKR